MIPLLLSHLDAGKGLKGIWVSPIRALTKEIKISAERAIEAMGLSFRVGIRTGDTSTSEKKKLKTNPPNLLITTPESLHVILAQRGYPKFLQNVQCVVCDEWHELVGSKRGVQTELALSRMRALNPQLRTWGISATIGNMKESLDILVGPTMPDHKKIIIKSDVEKIIDIETILPDEIDHFPWAGHIGLQLLPKIIPIIYNSQSTLIFTNTRAQSELWYQRLLDAEPDLAGQMAMHHGSISRELRDWVEDALHKGSIKAAVCTSSLDLGVDFRPVETIIQIGSPKGVARFVQRAGRSGHHPGAISKIYFLPTHALEIAEGAALREAMHSGIVEDRIPYIRCFDVLIQYLMTLAVSEGFEEEEIYNEIIKTHCFQSVSSAEWEQCLEFVQTGGATLEAYEEFHKVSLVEGRYIINNKRTAMRHRLNIGTIVSDGHMIITYMNGKKIGTVEEWFISQLMPGDTFWFAGRSLELIRTKEMRAFVKPSKKKKGKVPSYMGGRMPLSSRLAQVLRDTMHDLANGNLDTIELQALQPIADIQKSRSLIPAREECLVEYCHTKEGHHLTFYPYEGRHVHEGMAALFAYRISRIRPISFTIAMNDYGFELLSDQPIPIEEALEAGLISPAYLTEDIKQSINNIELSRRRFRDIASISGLIFKGYPGKYKKNKHLQSSAQLIFDVYQEYDPDHVLYLQAYEEAMTFQLEEARLRAAMHRMSGQELVLKYPEKPTPWAFPIMVDRLREKLSSEKLKDRIARMTIDFSDGV